jgi:galactokinase
VASTLASADGFGYIQPHRRKLRNRQVRFFEVGMELTKEDQETLDKLGQLAKQNEIKIAGGKVRRTSSRFCLGVEHGDYNGTELFGVGTDRFIWLAYRPNGTNKIRLFSGNFPHDGRIEYTLGNVPAPKSAAIAETWGRFPYGIDYILQREGFQLKQGIDGVLFGNIPGGGMSRSASLCINLILSLFDVNEIEVPSVKCQVSSLKKEGSNVPTSRLQTSNFKLETPLQIVDLAQAVENDYIGSPCGKLDQTMVLFAKEGMGTYYNPKDRSIEYVPIGQGATDFRIVVLDTGTDRPGLEKATYAVRRRECEELVGILQKAGYKITCLADVKDESLYHRIMDQFGRSHPNHSDRLKYIYHAQQRFYRMMDAWRAGDIETVGAIFRQDGLGLRDDYKISGPELETMCDAARAVPGVLGERMLGGGDKGASGALVRAESVEAVKRAVEAAYPRSRPGYKDKYAAHVCKVVDGVRLYENLL